MSGQGSGGNVLAALASFFIPGLGQLLSAGEKQVKGQKALAESQSSLGIKLSFGSTESHYRC